MKNFNIAQKLTLIIAILFTTFLTSCSKDEETNPDIARYEKGYVIEGDHMRGSFMGYQLIYDGIEQAVKGDKNRYATSINLIISPFLLTEKIFTEIADGKLVQGKTYTLISYSKNTRTYMGIRFVVAPNGNLLSNYNNSFARPTQLDIP